MDVADTDDDEDYDDDDVEDGDDDGGVAGRLRGRLRAHPVLAALGAEPQAGTKVVATPPLTRARPQADVSMLQVRGRDGRWVSSLEACGLEGQGTSERSSEAAAPAKDEIHRDAAAAEVLLLLPR